MINRWSRALGQVYEALAWMACAMLFALMLVICADVFLRNVPLIPGLRGMPATNDLSEAFLYLITLFAGPWLLRLGQHIRVEFGCVPSRPCGLGIANGPWMCWACCVRW